ncbi:MAG: hypothetical protein KGJ23_13025 [Euryarchaeota archaeon]|nr:hypothetical protein [Euryarchaeota archaeon]MDE2046733.1 hypothetical protein [Thermoplasmata archaeon]
MDLLIGSVRDRRAGVDVPEPWISARPRRRRLFTITGSTTTEISVARPEALWVLKLAAGRDQDLTDLYAIATTPVEVDEVRALFQSLWCPTLETKLRRSFEVLAREKTYEDSMSRLETKRTEATREGWRRFRDLATQMVPS